jgi:hypothetical protein
VIDKPASFWTDEKLLTAAIGELISHGGNQRDLDVMRAEFVKRRYDKSGDGDNTGNQAGQIPD